MTVDPILSPVILLAASLVVLGREGILLLRSRDRGRTAVLSLFRLLAFAMLAVALLRPCFVTELPRQNGGVTGVVLLGERDSRGEAIIGSSVRRPETHIQGINEVRGDGATWLSATRRCLIAASGRPEVALLTVDERDDLAGAEASAGVLRSSGAMVFAVAPRPPELPTMELSNVRIIPPDPQARTLAVAVTTLKSRSPEGFEAQVSWGLDGRQINVREIPVDRGSEELRLEHAFVVPAAGLHRVRIQVTGPKYVSSGKFFRPRAGPRRILILERAPRPVFRAFRRALEGSPVFLVEAASTIERTGGGSFLPRTAAAWDGVDAIVLGNLASGDLPTGFAGRVKRYVESGGGLIVLAGDRNLSRGGWSQTELASILPMDLSTGGDVIRGPLDTRPSGSVSMARPYPFGSLWAGLESPISIEGSASWRDLPELSRAFEAGEAADGTAAPIVVTRPGKTVPFLVTGNVGPGRVAAVMSDDVWKWASAGRPTRIAHDSFWRDLVLGVARSSLTGEGGIWLEASAETVQVADSVRVTVYVTDPEWEVDLVLRRNSANGGAPDETLALKAGSMVRTITLRMGASGTSSLQARTRRPDRERISAPVEIEVIPRIEVKPTVDTSRLEAECLLSGGLCASREEPRSAVASFVQQIERVGPREMGSVAARRRIPALITIILFLAACIGEWALHKAWRPK